MRKPSKGVLIYVLIMFLGWVVNLLQLWHELFQAILKIGLTDTQNVKAIESMFLATPTSTARWLGGLVGGLIALIVMGGVLRLKSWARKLLLLLTSLGLIVYVVNMPTFLSLYRYGMTKKLWLGYYLFIFLAFTGFVYALSLLIFFSRKGVKRQFE